MHEIESHPFTPFLPINARILVLGSFPPKKERWSMDFYYPNFNNDMWRIFGLVFFRDKDYFISPDRKRFDKDSIMSFCSEAGIALYDAAYRVIRMKDNASDKFLEVIEPSPIPDILSTLPRCNAIAATGQKAAETVSAIYGCTVPAVGDSTAISFEDRQFMLHRLPSSSRAYPMKLEEKAAVYSKFLKEIL